MINDKDLNDWESGYHSKSWLSVDELEKFDYCQQTEDRRVIRNNNGGCTCEPGEGKKMTYREFLGPSFQEDIKRLREAGADRVVFWFS